MTRLTTVADAEAAADRAAALVVRLLDEARAARGVAHLALAGGTTPRRVYELLAERVTDWEGVELWWGDERCVPVNDPRSNARMAIEALLSKVDVPAERIHPMPGDRGPDDGARAYAAELAEHVLETTPDGLPVLDVCLLGLGEDGHTASLFPGAPALQARGVACVGVRDAPKPPPERITLSLDALRAARRCLLVVTGEAKAAALAGALGEPTPRVPASLLRRGRLEVVADDAASPG